VSKKQFVEFRPRNWFILCKYRPTQQGIRLPQR